MAYKQHLQFLLALGGQRMVVIRNQDRLHAYTAEHTAKPNVSPKRLFALVQSK